MSLASAQIESEFIEPDDSDIPDPDISDLNLCGDSILIRQYQPPTTWKGKTGATLFLPNQVKKDAAYLQNVAKVLKLGITAFKDPNVKWGEPRFPHGFYERPWANPGDWIVYPRHAGQRFKYKGVQLMIIKDSQVLFTIKDPKDVDTLDMVLSTSND